MARGYSFEKSVVDYFNQFNDEGWYARRLGGSSSGLPDVLITHNHNDPYTILWSMECKSTYGNYAIIPPIQIQRCESMLQMFSVYEFKNVVFGFKFSTKKPRKSHCYFIKVLELGNVKSVMCNTNGTIKTTKMDKYKSSSEFKYIKYKSLEGLKKNLNLLFS